MGGSTRTALIDGDVVAYESAFRGETKYSFGGQKFIDTNPSRAIANLDARIQTIKEHTDADEVLIALSCPTRRYFRHDLYPGYKSGRGKKPECLAAVREHILEEYRTKVKPGLEADDVLGLLATSRVIPGEKIVVTCDKDLDQIPGLHLNPSKLSVGIYSVTPTEGARWFMRQTLTGDTVDTYPGCPGIGPIKANRILNGLQTLAEMWQSVVKMFVLKGLTEQDALVQARLARILQSSDWDWQKKEHKLWTPPT